VRIPFNKSFIVGKELDYVAQAVLSGETRGDGAFGKRCDRLLQRALSAPRVMLTMSCTAALEMAAILCDIEPGDEVVLPSYTFTSTANAFALRGAKLVFVDIRNDTLNLDEKLVPAAVTDRTRAIVPVHYAGVSCEMDSLVAIARQHDLRVIEDAAQGVNATYKGRYLGTIGDIGALSFHETKNFSCGEGGAFIANDPSLVERAEIIREKGTNRSQFFRGEIDKYSWIDIGSSWAPSDILAAFLYAQLENMDMITEQRRLIYGRYDEAMARLSERGILSTPTVPSECGSNYHMYYVLLEDEPCRAALIEHLRAQDIHAVFHYVPLHTSAMGKRMGYSAGMLPVTEQVSERLLRLPFYYQLTEAETDRVVASIFEFFGVKP